MSNKIVNTYMNIVLDPSYIAARYRYINIHTLDMNSH
jgi:hypothetical protein